VDLAYCASAGSPNNVREGEGLPIGHDLDNSHHVHVVTDDQPPAPVLVGLEISVGVHGVAEASDEKGREGEPFPCCGPMIADGLASGSYIDLDQATNHMLALCKPRLVDDETPHSRNGPHVVVGDLLVVPYHWLPHGHTYSPR